MAVDACYYNAFRSPVLPGRTEQRPIGVIGNAGSGDVVVEPYRAGAGSKEIRSFMPVAAASCSSVRVDDFIQKKLRETFTFSLR